MMPVLFAASAALLAGMSLIAMVNLLFAPRLHRYRRPPVGSASLLVPARDEADNLMANLPAMLAMQPPPLEVLILDDASTDGTAAVVERYSGSSGVPVRLIPGAPLPAGWGGKSWACHQLAAEARGETLVFCDADVMPGREAVGLTVAAMEEVGAGMLTALPRHRFTSWEVGATVPLVAWLPVVALLPLALVPRVKPPAVAMGNGQWIAFTRAAYRAMGGHEAVRGDVLEDVALARRAKRAGVRLLVAAAPRTLEVCMYSGWPTMRRGFGKNLYALSGGSPAGFGLMLGIFLLVAVVPLVTPIAGGGWATVSLMLLVLVRICGAMLLGQGGATILLHPVGVVLAMVIAVESTVRGGEGVEWKGRRMPGAARGGVGGEGR